MAAGGDDPTAAGAPGLVRRAAHGGVVLLAGLATAQAAAFLRNAVLGYTLSMGDFGIAAALTLTLQVVEALSDLGSERLVVQDEDGDSPALLDTVHTVLALRGLLIAVALLFAAGPIARLLSIPDAAAGFELIALVPLIRAFVHQGMRRSQRRLENAPFAIVEAVPQLLGALLVLPLVWQWPGYLAAALLAIVQAAATVLVSHLVGRSRYRLGLDRAVLGRLLRFGWPIWLSAFPLLLVFHADRALIAAAYGMEALAVYAAAFMLTMVPMVIIAKVGTAIVLPVLAPVRGDATAFLARARALAEVVAATGAGFAAALQIAGDPVLALVFGPGFKGQGALVGALAVMFAVRMVQVVPAMTLMAHAETRPLLAAGLVRASAIGLSAAAIANLAGLEVVAAAGIVGELGALAVVTAAARRAQPGFLAVTAAPLLLFMASIGLSVAIAQSLGGDPASLHRLWPGAAAALTAMAAAALASLAVRQQMRRSARPSRRGGFAEA
jgi:O-antigen/teichoic acid export membrane protein